MFYNYKSDIHSHLIIILGIQIMWKATKRLQTRTKSILRYFFPRISKQLKYSSSQLSSYEMIRQNRAIKPISKTPIFCLNRRKMENNSHPLLALHQIKQTFESKRKQSIRKLSILRSKIYSNFFFSYNTSINSHIIPYINWKEILFFF